MKKQILLCVLMGISIITFSQEKNFHFGASFNAKITHSDFNQEYFDDSHNEFSFTLSGNIYFNVGKKFHLISGLSFSQYYFNLIDYSPIFVCDLISGGVDPKNSYVKNRYSTSYFGIPLEVRWKIAGEKNNLYFQFGFEGLYKIGLNEKPILYECNEGNGTELEQWPFQSYDVNKFLLLSKIGIGYEFRLNEKLNLFFEPNIEYSLTNYFDWELVNSKYFNIGLNTGIVF